MKMYHCYLTLAGTMLCKISETIGVVYPDRDALVENMKTKTKNGLYKFHEKVPIDPAVKFPRMQLRDPTVV